MPLVSEALANAAGPDSGGHRLHEGRPRPGGPLGSRCRFITLGTDGFGRSDTRQALRRHFETDAAHVVVAVLDGLRQAGEGKAEEVEDAIRRYGIDPESPNPGRA